MTIFFRSFLPACTFFVLLGIALVRAAAPEGFVEGQLKILSGRPVEAAESNRVASTSRNFNDYPLIVLRKGGEKQVAGISADANGHYRISLPPGDYVLDLVGRIQKRIRVQAQPFRIAPNETVHVDLTIRTGLANE